MIGTDGQFHEVSVSREAAGFPKFKRNYSAVEFNLERPFDGKWYAKVNYVWSHSYGTTEGQVRSIYGAPAARSVAIRARPRSRPRRAGTTRR